jgi:predicted RNA-binding Zn ribbon-like protein
VLGMLDKARFQLDPRGGLSAASAGDPWSAFIADLLPVLIGLVAARDRLAICGNPHCRLVFLDASRSGTRRWCDDGGCGNRDRVGRFRRSTPGVRSARPAGNPRPRSAARPIPTPTAG